LDTTIWIVQIFLAVVFFMAGIMKMMTPKGKLAPKMAWVENFSPSTIRIIASLEIIGSVGIILPWVTQILPVLTPMAAIGLALTMAGAAITHLRRREFPMIGFNLFLFILALFVVYGRFITISD
jgi:uncharacterized membrane protein YphA (DoxX/SURF4 family)